MTVDIREGLAPTSRRPRPRVAGAAIVAGWIALVAAARVIGIGYVRAHHRRLAIGAMPWAGRWAFEPSLLGRLCVAGFVLASAAWWLPTLATRAKWRQTVVGASASSAGLALVVAWSGLGWTHWHSVQTAYGQYTPGIDAVGPVAYLRHYVDLQGTFPTHLRAHPPGLVLGLWAAGRVGLSGPGLHLVLLLVAGAVATAAALVAFREVAGEDLARGAAPFVAVAPVVVWRTNPDVLFTALAVAAVALVVVASGRRGRASAGLAFLGGLVFAAALFTTYGVVLLAIPALAVAWHRRAGRVVVAAGAGVVVGLLVPAAFGFWWPAGLLETHVQYQESLARVRGYRYWLLGNAAIFAVLIGPATVAGLLRLRDKGARVLVFGALACPVLAGLSGLSSGETERIWQPFVPLVLLAGASLWVRGARFDVATARRWLVLQASVAFGFQAILQSAW